MIITATKRRTSTSTDASTRTKTRPRTETIRALQARESRESPDAGTPGTPGTTGMPGATKGTGWTVFGYLIAGMVAYGGIGWLIGRAVHITMLFPGGMLVGLAISLAFVIYRYGVQAPRNDVLATRNPQQSPRKESDR